LRLSRIKTFNEYKKSFIPPNISHVAAETATQDLNHLNEFVINAGHVWVKRIGAPKEAWQPIYFDSMGERKPVAISVDGANLTVCDDKGELHYKKVLLETPRLKEDDQYAFADTSSTLNWKERWFTLPLLHRIVNIWTGKRLVLPKDARAWSISHRGQFNLYLEDAVKRHHLVETGVTTLYVLDGNGRDIHLHDPWSPSYLEVVLPVPETPTTTFDAINMNAASSTLMIIGYENGTNLKVYTQLADIDSLGWNPGIRYSYNAKEPDWLSRVLPLEGWQEHALPPLNGKASISQEITILQTGIGNEAREMRIVGTNEEGIAGFYHKALTTKEWSFTPDTTCKADAIVLTKPCTVKMTPRVHEWRGDQGHIDCFGHNTVTAKLTLIHEGKTIPLQLVRKENLVRKTLRTGQSTLYHIVVPDSKKQTIPYFEGRKVIPTIITQEGDKLTIKPKRFAGVDFCLEFNSV